MAASQLSAYLVLIAMKMLISILTKVQIIFMKIANDLVNIDPIKTPNLVINAKDWSKGQNLCLKFLNNKEKITFAYRFLPSDFGFTSKSSFTIFKNTDLAARTLPE